MMKSLFALFAILFAPTVVQAQTVPQYCNAAAVYDTAALGAVKIVSAPTIGGIFVCGFSFGSAATSTIGVQLSFSTAGVINTNAVGAPVVTQALQNRLTPAWQFISPTSAQFLVDHQPSYGGLFVPPGNQLNVNVSLGTGSIQAIVYYWTQNP